MSSHDDESKSAPVNESSYHDDFLSSAPPINENIKINTVHTITDDRKRNNDTHPQSGEIMITNERHLTDEGTKESRDKINTITPETTELGTKKGNDAHRGHIPYQTNGKYPINVPEH